jgi:hypothetical protein
MSKAQEFRRLADAVVGTWHPVNKSETRIQSLAMRFAMWVALPKDTPSGNYIAALFARYSDNEFACWCATNRYLIADALREKELGPTRRPDSPPAGSPDPAKAPSP